jgi:hypothetical protein
MDAERQKIVDRILKLLAMAKGTSFDAEAETACKLADNLIAKHNVSLARPARSRSPGQPRHAPSTSASAALRR